MAEEKRPKIVITPEINKFCKMLGNAVPDEEQAAKDYEKMKEMAIWANLPTGDIDTIIGIKLQEESHNRQLIKLKEKWCGKDEQVVKQTFTQMVKR